MFKAGVDGGIAGRMSGFGIQDSHQRMIWGVDLGKQVQLG